jgi:VanZ family protein
VPNTAAPPLRLRWLWRAGAAGLLAALVTLCLLPASEVPSLGVSDGIEHAAGYFVLMLWLAGLSARARWLVVALALVALGVGLEWLQGALGRGRVAEARDVAANTLGVAFGVALAFAGLGDWMRWVEARVFRT